MVWKKIKEPKMSKIDYQQAALYGLFFIIGLCVLSWIVQLIN